LRILELNTPTSLSKKLLSLVRIDSPFKRIKSYARGQLSNNSEISINEVDSLHSLEDPKPIKSDGQGVYDVLIVPEELADHDFAAFSGFLDRNGGTILFLSSKSTVSYAEHSTITAATASGQTIGISRLLSTKVDQGNKKLRNILIVEEPEQTSFNDAWVSNLSSTLGQSVDRILLHSLAEGIIKPNSTVISTIELTRPLMSTLTAEEMVKIKLITDNAVNLVWITGGNSFVGENPDYALMSGLSRALMLEQPSLNIFNIGLNPSEQTMDTMHILDTLVDQIHHSNASDYEFIMHNDILHISRMVPEENMNRIFREKQGEIPTLTRLGDSKPARLTIGTVGQFDTLSFKQERPNLSPLAPGTIEVEVKSVGLNAKVKYSMLFFQMINAKVIIGFLRACGQSGNSRCWVQAGMQWNCYTGRRQ